MAEDQTGIRQCVQCNEWLPTGEFKQNQQGYFYKTCKSCGNRIAREKYHAKQAEAGKAPRKKAPEDRDGQRWCRDCEEWLPVDDFSPTKYQKSGRASYCRPCMNRRNHATVVAKAEAEGREVRKVRTGGPVDRDGERMCRDCERWLPLEGFVPSSTREGGRGSYCQPCMNQRSQASYAKRILEEEGREVRMPEDLPEGVKRCRDCGEVKAHADFGRVSAKRDGMNSYCKPCANMRTQESRQRLHGGTREYHLRERYGIGSVEVQAKLDAQGGVCGICRWHRPPYHVDHDHESGKVRGMLCFNCNNGLGHFRDNVEVMREAIDYVLMHLGFEEDARYVPEDMVDPKGTWALPEPVLEDELRWILGNLGQSGGSRESSDPDTTTGRGSP